MDGSFLSNDNVISASRDFVCLRLATYEDAAEANYLRKIYSGRAGNLENTVFALLSHDGQRLLARAGRGPSFRSAVHMAQKMNQIIRAEYPDARDHRWDNERLPEVRSLELAINVAACDGLPLIVSVGDDKSLPQIRKQLLPHAWSEEFAGKFVFASANSSADLRPLGHKPNNFSGVYLVEPDPFGLSGRVMEKIADATTAVDPEGLTSMLNDFTPPKKDHRQHVVSGFQFGFKWETAIPITDLQGIQAAKRLWRTQGK